jgi:uncharacterized phage-like protein YoqJ
VIYAATGHRPGKAFITYTDVGVLRTFARGCIEQLSPAPTEFVSGMAPGWDQMVAWACVDLRIPVVAAVPYVGQDGLWPRPSRDAYELLLSKAARIHPVNDGPYAAWKLHKRNEWMVNNSGHMLALWDGNNSGGTYACLKYAEKQGRPTTNLYSAWKSQVSK